MLELFAIVILPFMVRALIAGVILGIVLAYLGVFATLRNMSFFGDGIAHASLAGIAIGITTGFFPYATAVIVGTVLGGIIYILERRLKLASDAVIGIIFVTGLAFGIALLSLQAGYQPELISFLFGNILTLSTADVVIIAVAALIINTFLLRFSRQLALTALDRDTAWLAGIKTEALEFSFYLVLSLAIVLGVKLLGIILVSALLIIPPTTAKLLARSFRKLLIWSIVMAEIAVIVGLIISYLLDLPSGATIVLSGAVLFFIIAIFQGFAPAVLIKKRT